MSIRRLSYALLLEWLLVGCHGVRQPVTPKSLASVAEQLVVTCFIAPQDTVLTARVSRSVPVGQVDTGTSRDVADATVTLATPTQSITLVATPYQDDAGKPYTLYQVSATGFPIRAGTTCTLRVSVPDGRVATSTTTIPAAVPIDAVTLDSIARTDDGQLLTDYFVRLHWHDRANQPNYYRIAGSNEYRYAALSATQPPGGQGVWYFQSSSLTTDAGMDGQAMVSTRGYLLTPSYWVNGQAQTSRPVGQLKAYLLAVDENYYRYHEALYQQAQVAGNLLAEPVLIPTTIAGGLGCFGAYNQATFSQQIR